jgi:hypothetical protein
MTLERDIKQLAGRGLGEIEIAQWLGISQERVGDVLARDRRAKQDRRRAASFPAPPPWPVR